MALKAACLLIVLAAAGLAQETGEVVLRQTFQTDAGSWTAMGETSAVGRAAGRQGIVFTYDLGPKLFSGLVSPAPAEFAKTRRIRLHVKTDHATAMGLLLSEKKPGGGNYMAWFWSPAETWQWVEFTPADFTVSDGPDDPKDSDGRLDLADVDGIGIFDLAQFFAQMPANPEFPLNVWVDPGQHKIDVDTFEVLSSPSADTGAGGNLRMSTLDRNFVDWVTPGGMNLKLVNGSNPLHETALQADYTQADGRYQLLLHRVAGSAMAKAKRVRFDIASEREVTLIISLETANPGGGQGPRFTIPIFPPGGKEVFHVDLDLADFKGDGKFDPAKWRTMAIIDVSTAGGGAPDPNTLWIGNVAAVQ